VVRMIDDETHRRFDWLALVGELCQGLSLMSSRELRLEHRSY
jgi:hypothetical protein